MLIGKSRKDGVDWVQDQLDYVARPLAEMAYRGLVRRGLVVEGETEVLAENYLDPDHIRRVGMEEYQSNERRTIINQRRSRSAARSQATRSQTTRQKGGMKWEEPNYTDDLTGKPNNDGN